MNKRVLITIVVIMSVITLGGLRSFFLPERISKRILSGQASAFELSYGKKLKLAAYYQEQLRHATIGSHTWLRAATQLAKTQSGYALALADYYHQQSDINTEQFWLRHAVKLNNVEAAWQLANLYVQQDNLPQAKALLETLTLDKNTPYNIKALALLIEIALIDGDQEWLAELTAILKTKAPEHRLVKELSYYAVQESTETETWSLNQHCIASIQMYATNLANLRRTNDLINKVRQSSLDEFICFSTPRYIPLSALDCRHQDEEMIRCNEAIWQNYLSSIQTRFIGVMLPAGGANVNHGLLYIDSKDSLSVFKHELLHLLGFVDEYPLPNNHAKCMTPQKNTFAHNIAVLPKQLTGKRPALRQAILAQLAWEKMIKPDTPIMTGEGVYWRLGTPEQYRGEIGLFYSETCQNRQPMFEQHNTDNVQSFKPIFSLTSLAYHELNFPHTYLQLLKQAPEKFLMPSFHENIALATSL